MKRSAKPGGAASLSTGSASSTLYSTWEGRSLLELCDNHIEEQVAYDVFSFGDKSRSQISRQKEGVGILRISDADVAKGVDNIVIVEDVVGSNEGAKEFFGRGFGGTEQSCSGIFV